MSSNTQHNTDRPFGTNTASTGNTASGTNTVRTGYDSSPLAYETTAAQHDSSRVGEEGLKQHHGHGLGTGMGHHKSHREGAYLGQDTGVAGGGDMKTTTETYPRPAEQAYSGVTGAGYTTTTGSGVGTDNQYSTTGTGHPSHHHHGIGGGHTSTAKTTSDTSPRLAEQAYPGATGAGTYQAHSGVTGDPSAAATTKGYSTGDTTGSYVGTTTGSGTGTEGQYATTTGHHSEALPSHHKHHLGGVHSQEVTDTGVKPSMTDKIVGGAEKAAGKMTSNTGMYQKGAERAAGETAHLRKPTA